MSDDATAPLPGTPRPDKQPSTQDASERDGADRDMSDGGRSGVEQPGSAPLPDGSYPSTASDDSPGAASGTSATSAATGSGFGGESGSAAFGGGDGGTYRSTSTEEYWPEAGAGSPAAPDEPAGGTAGSESGGSGTGGSGSAGNGTAGGGEGGSGAGGTDRARRRRRLIMSGVAGAAVLVIILGCLAGGLAIRSGVRVADRAGNNEERWERLQQSCLELETRLNRLIPPGATGGDPRHRAAAIRDENAAVRPLLDELAAMNADREHGRDHDREEWTAGWRTLIDARTAYASALERRLSGGEPAFFISPRRADGDSVVGEVERGGPRQCAAPARRLGHPDL